MKVSKLPRKNKFNFNGEEAEHYGNAVGTILSAVGKVKNGEAPVTNNYNTYGETANGISGRTIAIIAAIVAVVIIAVVIIRKRK